MFDLRRFWLSTTVYALVFGVVIASAWSAFNALVGMPARDPYRQAVPRPDAIQASTGKGIPVEVKREPAASGNPVSRPAQRAQDNSVATMTPPPIALPDIQIIVPERTSRRGGGTFRSGI